VNELLAEALTDLYLKSNILSMVTK